MLLKLIAVSQAVNRFQPYRLPENPQQTLFFFSQQVWEDQKRFNNQALISKWDELKIIPLSKPLPFSTNGTLGDAYGGKLRSEGVGGKLYLIFFTPTYLVILSLKGRHKHEIGLLDVCWPSPHRHSANR